MLWRLLLLLLRRLVLELLLRRLVLLLLRRLQLLLWRLLLLLWRLLLLLWRLFLLLWRLLLLLRRLLLLLWRLLLLLWRLVFLLLWRLVSLLLLWRLLLRRVWLLRRVLWRRDGGPDVCSRGPLLRRVLWRRDGSADVCGRGSGDPDGLVPCRRPSSGRRAAGRQHPGQRPADRSTTQAEQTFTTPELTPGKAYAYDFRVRVEVVRDGKTVTRSQKVTVQAGRQSQADFGELSRNDAPARVTIKAPADARVTVDDVNVPRTTADVPDAPLEGGRTYYYTVKADLVRNGKTVSDSKRVTVEAGKDVLVEFQEPSVATAGR